MAKEDQLIAEWRQNVLSELKYFRTTIDGLKEDISDLKEDNAAINTTMKQLGKQLESHPTGCPINRKGIEDIVEVQLKLYEGTLPSKQRKLISELLTIVTAIIAIIAFAMAVLNKPSEANSNKNNHLYEYRDSLINNKHYE